MGCPRRRAWTGLLSALWLGACAVDRGPIDWPTRPTLAPLPPPSEPEPPPAPARWPARIAVGQEVEGHLTASPDGLCTRAVQAEVRVPCHRYLLTSPASGVLTARLAWNYRAGGTILLLNVGGTEYEGVEPALSPVIARRPITAGETLEVGVLVWDFDWIPNDRYTLVTSLE